MSELIKGIAIGLAISAGHEWNKLTPDEQGSYLHNAEPCVPPPVAIETEQKVVETSSPDTCNTCNGKGFTELNHGLAMVACEACGATGNADGSGDKVSTKFIRPEAKGEVVIPLDEIDKSQPITIKLNCKVIEQVGEVLEVKEREDGLDVVAKLTPERAIKGAAIAGEPLYGKGKPEIPKGQYVCSKCSAVHRDSSKIGKKHLKYRG